MDLFVEVLATVREALGLDQIHLLGHSFGGMISLEYLLTNPSGIMSLTLHSTPVSFPLYITEWNRLTSELPEDVQETLTKHEAAGMRLMALSAAQMELLLVGSHREQSYLL